MYAQFRHPAAGAGAASAAAGAGAAHAPWFSRDDVLRQLAVLGYTVRLAHNRSFFFQFFYVCLLLCSMFHAPSKHQISFPKQAVCLDTLLGAAPLAGPKNPKKEGFTVLPNVVPVFFLPLPLLFFSPSILIMFSSPLCANTGSTRISA